MLRPQPPRLHHRGARHRRHRHGVPVSTPQILERRPDLLSTVLTMLSERFPSLTPEEIMVIAGIPTDQLLHTRAAQDLLDRGRQEGEARGEDRGRAAEAALAILQNEPERR